LDASEADLVRGLAAMVSFPEQAIAESSKGSLGQASSVMERAATLESTPAIAAALDRGAVTAGHVDAITRAGKTLDPSQREELSDRVDALVDVAEHASQAEFARRVRDEARRLQAADGMDTLERQRRATSLRTCHLRALALALADLVLTGVTATKPGRPEYVVVVDADAPTPTGPSVEFSIPVEVPWQVLAELAGDADVQAVVVHYDRCKLHHVIWWRHGGRTDLDDLLPVCVHHHHEIHDAGWEVTLGPNRQLTIRYPDGTVQSTGPPTIRAA
jgi:hypothetical protein